MTRLLLVLFLLAATASAVVAYRDPEQLARASDTVSDMLRKRAKSPASTVHIPRGQGGEFAIHARINGVVDADGDRHRRDLGGADLRDREGDRAAAGTAGI